MGSGLQGLGFRVGGADSNSQGLGFTGWGPLVISRVLRALNWVIRTLS